MGLLQPPKEYFDKWVLECYQKEYIEQKHAVGFLGEFIEVPQELMPTKKNKRRWLKAHPGIQ